MPQLPLDEYVDFIETYTRVHFPKLGHLYSFLYLHDRSNKELKDLKFSDFFPMIFVYQINITSKTFTGFNIHNVPPKRLMSWLQIMDKYSNDDNPQEAEKFVKLKTLFANSGFAMRQYSMARVRYLREIPRRDWILLEQHYANTTYGASMAELSAKYYGLLK